MQQTACFLLRMMWQVWNNLLQDPEAGRLQSENAQLTDTVIQQRQLITELRSQLQHNGTQAPPEQVQPA